MRTISLRSAQYFKNPDDKEPKGVLPLDGAEVVEDSDKTKSKKDQQFAFQVKVPERKVSS